MSESLDIVADEMRYREQVQDGQIQALAIKSSFLFTAGTTVLAASAAVIGVFLNPAAPHAWGLLWPALIATGAYIWLTVSFFQAFRIRTYKRTPEPERLMEYIQKPVEEAKDLIADGRRYAIQCNQDILEEQTVWIGRGLIALMTEIGALAATLLTLAFI